MLFPTGGGQALTCPTKLLVDSYDPDDTRKAGTLYEIYTYDEAEAKKDLKEILEEEEILDDILKHDRYDWETDEDKLDEFYDSVLEDFSEDTGISSKGYDVLSGYLTDAWEFVGNIGKQPTGILNLYMLAFKLAMQQLS